VANERRGAVQKALQMLHLFGGGEYLWLPLVTVPLNAFHGEQWRFIKCAAMNCLFISAAAAPLRLAAVPGGY